MAQIISYSDSVTLIPSGYDSANSSYRSINSSYPVTNGYTDASSTSYAYIQCNTGSRAVTYISYTFDTSNIPDDAIIDSVACSAKGRVSSTSYISTAVFQLYAGSTAKGNSVSARTTTATAYTLTPGTWTRSELENIQIRYTGTRGTSNTSSNAYLYFYGATLTINYSVNNTQYTLIATSEVDGAEISPLAETAMEGESVTFTINLDGISIDDLIIEDNGVDIIDQVEHHTIATGSFSDTFIPSSFDEENSVYNTNAGENGVYSTNVIANGLTNHSSTTRCALYSVQGSGATSSMYYNFDCSQIPETAVITSVSCQFKGGTQGSSYYSSYTAQLTTGTTLKGTAQSVTGSNSSPTTVTISGGNSWTREELDDIKIKFSVTRGSSNTTTDSTWSFFGATLTVAYTVSDGDYYTYTLDDINDDHTIVITRAGVYIPPEEDPQYTYESLTISSINAITDPGPGTTRIITGSNQTITITPTDPQLTLALDNGVDITNQLQGGVPNNTYTITTQVTGASYGFNLNSSTGYYVSTNNGVAKSASVARLNLNFESACIITIQYINYAEANYDYGMFGRLDTAVATDGLTASSGSSSPSDSTSNYQLAMASNSSSAQTITYEVSAGQHFIDIKYGKDDGTNSNNDSLQWKVLNIEATSAGGEYTYTLTNINQKHSLIFIFGDVTYYFVESSGTNVRLFPDGQYVMLPGDKYRLNIVPNGVNDTITVTDNNVDVTSTLIREEGVDKNNNPVVSYEYLLTNISAAHNIIVTGATVISGGTLYHKENGTWNEVIKIWKKENGAWSEVEITYCSDNDIKYLKKGKTIKKLAPSSYSLSNTSYLTIADADNMYNITDNDTYSTITHTRASTSYSYYLYLRGFDFSQIPNDANIESFTIRFKARESGLSTSTTYRPYLINNTTTITGTAAVTTTTTAVTEFTDVSATWTTIKGYGNNFGIRFTLRRSASGTTGYLYVYGAELEVVYS